MTDEEENEKINKHIQIKIFDSATHAFDLCLMILFIKIRFSFNQTIILIDTCEIN